MAASLWAGQAMAQARLTSSPLDLQGECRAAVLWGTDTSAECRNNIRVNLGADGVFTMGLSVSHCCAILLLSPSLEEDVEGDGRVIPIMRMFHYDTGSTPTVDQGSGDCRWRAAPAGGATLTCWLISSERRGATSLIFHTDDSRVLERFRLAAPD